MPQRYTKPKNKPKSPEMAYIPKRTFVAEGVNRVLSSDGHVMTFATADMRDSWMIRVLEGK